MNYVVKMTPRAEREAKITKHLTAPTGEEDFYEFRNSKIKLKIIRIDINIPVYRMENFRTYTDQREFVSKDKLDPNYFLKGQELQTVQQKQHEILMRLANKGKKDSISPITEVLEKEGQRERILISSTGVVINGNRRLAAMRELSVDATTYPSFSHVDCMVLPADATSDEIVDIEANLQAKPETKLEYDWIGDAQLVNRLLGMGRTTKQIADRLNRSEADIKNTLQALSEADIYLKDWANSPGQYSKVRDEAGQLFKDLPKLVAGKDPTLQAGSRAIAWALFDNRDKVPGRLYNFNLAIGKLAADVLDRVADELEIPITSNEKDNGVGDLAVDFGDSEEAVDYSALINAFKDEASKDEVVGALVEACQSAIESQQGQVSSKAALKAVNQAHAKLVSIDLSTAGKETRPGIAKQLQSILAVVAKLEEKLKSYNSSAQGDSLN